MLNMTDIVKRYGPTLVLDQVNLAVEAGQVMALMGENGAGKSTLVKILAGIEPADGGTVIYVTHRMPEVFDLTNRVTVLRNGKSFPALETATLSIDTLIEAMLGRQLGKMFPPRATNLGAESLSLRNCMASGLRAPISISVRRGEILALSGQVGSGASTVLRLLAGVTPIVSGDVRLEGRPYAPRNIAEGIASKVVYCSDDRKRDGIFAVRSVPENLSAPALGAISRFQLLSRGLERSHIRSIAAKFGLEERYFSRLAGNLSGGNQQKVALGKWIGLNPKILLVEEPTRGVDVGARAEIYRHLRQLADNGLSILFASSDTQEVLGLADRIATFFHGQMVQVVDAEAASAESLTRDVTRASEAA